MNRSFRLLSGLLSTALVGSLVAIVAAAAPAGAAPAPVTVTGSYTRGVVYGQAWNVHGTTTSAGSPVTTGTIQVFGRGSSASGWALVTTDTTPASFSYTVRPSRSYQLQIRYAPADPNAYTGWVSLPINVLVGRYPTGPFLKPHARLILGKVRPAYAHRPVLIYKRKCNGCRWHRFKRTHTSRRSWWHVHIPVRKMQYIAVVPRSPGYVASHSRIIKIRVIRVFRRPVAGVPHSYVGSPGVSGPAARNADRGELTGTR